MQLDVLILFSIGGAVMIEPWPPIPTKLRPADPDALRQSIAYALIFNGRRARFREGDSLMAEITADHLAKHLERCGYVIMREPPIGDFSRIAKGPPGKG